MYALIGGSISISRSLLISWLRADVGEPGLFSHIWHRSRNWPSKDNFSTPAILREIL